MSAFVPLLFHFSRKICSTSEIGADSLFVQYTAILTQKSFLLVNMDPNFVKFTTEMSKCTKNVVLCACKNISLCLDGFTEKFWTYRQHVVLKNDLVGPKGEF